MGIITVENMKELEPLADYLPLCAGPGHRRGRSAVLRAPAAWLDRQLEDGALWRTNAQHEILYRPLGEREDTVLTRASQGRCSF